MSYVIHWNFTFSAEKSSIKSEDDNLCEPVEDIDIDVVSHKDLDMKTPRSRSRSKSPPESTSAGRDSGDHPVKNLKKLEMKSKGNCIELESVQCHLETKELWEKFYELGTEMIITKTGR